MAYSTLTIKLVDASTVTLTIPTTDAPSAKKYIQQIPRDTGFYDDAGVFHPSSAILSITLS